MKSWRRSLAVLLLSGASVAGGFLGFDLVQNTQFARAEEKVQLTREQLSTVQDLSSIFKHVGQVVEPSVVNIDVKKTLKGVHQGLPFDDDMLNKLFPDRDGDGKPDLPPGMGGGGNEDGSFEQMGTGSGVIMESADGYGYIVTNNHVAGGATEMDITLSDGRKIKNATLVGADPKTDLAVVKIQADKLIPAKWGNSDDLSKGDWIMAFGSPFGYVGSMTHGIVSALHRQAGILGTFGYENFVQVDAPINPGNSGGPLVNIHGEVVGINTLIASRSGGFQGVGFAIPSNQAKQVYQILKDKGKVVRGWLGVEIADVSKLPEEAKSSGYQGEDGVLVKGVLRDTPAAGKLQSGDVVTALDGKPVKDTQQLRGAIALMAPDTEVTLQVIRDGKSQDVKIKLGEQPASEEAMASRAGGGGGPADKAQTLGLRLSDLTDEQAQRFGLTAKAGALVVQVNPRSIAAQAGIRAGDLITRIGRQKVTNAQTATDALSKADLKTGVRLFITNQQSDRMVFLQSAK